MTKNLDRKILMAQHMRHLKRVWGEEDAEAIMAKLLADAYHRAPSERMIQMGEKGVTLVQVVIRPRIHQMMIDLMPTWGVHTANDAFIYLVEQDPTKLYVPCRECVTALVARDGAQRTKAVTSKINASQKSRWDELRTGRTQAGTLERLIVEAQVRHEAYVRPPHRSCAHR